MRAPLWVIAWRLLWAPLFYVSLVTFCLVVLLGWGPDAARQALRDNT